jgi:hypothetical protein
MTPIPLLTSLLFFYPENGGCRSLRIASCTYIILAGIISRSAAIFILCAMITSNLTLTNTSKEFVSLPLRKGQIPPPHFPHCIMMPDSVVR